MKYYVTLTGLNYRFGTQPFTVGQKVKLVKEPENDFDHEAIRAELPGLGKVGYVANSTHTVLGQAGLPPVDPATGLPFGNEEDAIAF